MNKSDIGLVGLGVMGRNLTLNLEENGYKVSVYNRANEDETEIIDEFLNTEAQGRKITRTLSLQDLIASLKRPHVILIMVKAGEAVDAVIRQLQPYLEKGDILIDGGNSHYSDTGRRIKELNTNGIFLLGMGISGGEEGARKGPSLMPGGPKQAWDFVKPIFTDIAAKTTNNEPCCDWMGDEGAGHYVKMVHNGIEYADMQLVAETYHIMRDMMGLSVHEMASTFKRWRNSELDSYLLEITAKILVKKENNDIPVLDVILDVAGQKGTGRWVSIEAMNLGVPLPIISQSVFSRNISGLQTLREKASTKWDISQSKHTCTIDELQDALLASRIMALGEGLYLIKKASSEYNWNINLNSVILSWRKGCIIRSSLLQPAATAFYRQSNLEHLFLAPYFSRLIRKTQDVWRYTISAAIQSGIPVPAMAAALSQFDALRCEKLPTNLIQAQRDYFGAHQYERIDSPRGEYFHTKWIEKEDDK